MTKISDKQLTKGLIKALNPRPKQIQVKEKTEPSIIKLKVCHVSCKDADGKSTEFSDNQSRVFGNYGIAIGNKFYGTSYIAFDSVIIPKTTQTLRLTCDFIGMSTSKNIIVQPSYVFLDKDNKYKIIKSGIIGVSGQKRCTIDLPINDIVLNGPFCSTLHLYTNGELILQSAILNAEIRK